MGFAAQAESLDASGLAALVEPVENIRSLPPWSNPLGKLESAALAGSYCDSRILDDSAHVTIKTLAFAALVESVDHAIR